MAEELALIHGLPVDCSAQERLRELQNALLWINYRYYLAPLFWFVACGPYGPIALAGYAFLRAYQTWLARHNTPLERSQSGIDALLHWLDWIPVRLAGVAYALIGHGERALPAWFASLGDRRTSQYQVLTRLAQFALAREPHGPWPGKRFRRRDGLRQYAVGAAAKPSADAGKGDAVGGQHQRGRQRRR